MNTILKGQWKQMQGKVKETWGKLTDDDVKRTEGNVDQLVGVIQEKYGYAAARAQQEVADFIQALKKDDETTPKPTEATSVTPTSQ